MAPTTKLQAVNLLLATIGQAPVNTLSGGVSIDVIRAVNQLDTVSREVQSRRCTFNTEDCFTLNVNTSGQVVLPANCILVDILPTAPLAGSIVVRGNKLYDRKNHTYQFTQAVRAKATFLLEWDDLPEYARSYISIRAARQFSDNSEGSETAHRFTQQDENAALMTFQQMEGEMDDANFITNLTSGVGSLSQPLSRNNLI